jgi:hypothetical protein
MNTTSHSNHQKKIRQQYVTVKKQILQIGFVMEGSLSKRYLTCGKKSCRCLSNPAFRHGPYYLLTWKRNGRTVTQFIPPTLAIQYQEWIQNRQSLSKVFKQMQMISKKAIQIHLKSVTSPAEKSVISSVNKKLSKT